MKSSTIAHELTTLPKPISTRSAGVHVSNIIRCIAQEAHILKPQWWMEELKLVDVREITDEASILRISIGLAWEEWYIPKIKRIVDHPGEMELDGIYMTHDGESVETFLIDGANTKEVVIHEVKTTLKSTNMPKKLGEIRRRVREPEDEWMWMSQIMAYCKGVQTLRARMHVLFLRGDYSTPISAPALKIWDLEFTQQEVDDNWNLLTEYRDNHVAEHQA